MTRQTESNALRSWLIDQKETLEQIIVQVAERAIELSQEYPNFEYEFNRSYFESYSLTNNRPDVRPLFLTVELLLVVPSEKA